MPNSGTLHINDGTLSARVPAGAYMDAAIFGEQAGFELAVDSAMVHLGQEPNTYHANPILSLSLDKATMGTVALRLLDALGTPAFTEPEWLKIADACEHSSLIEFAAQIRTSYRINQEA